MFWEALSSIAACLSGIVVFASLIFLAIQIFELRRATYAQAFIYATNLLREEEHVRAREIIFNLRERAFEGWNEKEVEAAKDVCNTYDTIGTMTRQGMLPKKVVMDTWGGTIRDSWTIVEPIARKYREKHNSAHLWDDYEWLARAATG